LEEVMENDDAVDSATYVFKPMSLGFEVPHESLEEALEKIKAIQPLTYNTPASTTAVANSTAASNFVWGTGGTQAMRIDASGNVGVGASPTGSALSVHGKPVDLKPFVAEPTMDMLNDAASPYNIDPETLANLWVARFGKGWVGNDAVEDMEEDQVEWWRHLANRLRELGYLEMHTLASSYRVVLRIVE
jgi:hypothetical protein